MKTELHLGWCALLSVIVATGCSGASVGETEGEERVAESDQALVSGTTGVGVGDVSRISTDWTASAWQSEAWGAASGGFEYAVYNAEDTNTAHVTYPVTTTNDPQGRKYIDRIVCPGTNQVGTNFEDPFEDDSWVDAHHLPMPAGIAVLWGDPSLYLYDGYAWVSALVSPSDVFSARSNYVNGSQHCFRTSDIPNGQYPDDFEDALGGACVFRANQGTANNQAIAYQPSRCFRRQNGADSASGADFLDGGYLFPGNDDEDAALYAAYTDVTSGTLAMYRWPLDGNDSSWAAVPGDTSVHISGHPLLMSNENGLFIVAASGTSLKLWRYQGGFSGGGTIATNLAVGNVTLKDGVTQIRGVNYAARMLPVSGSTPAKMAIFYQFQNGSSTSLKGLLCDTVTLSCSASFTVGSSSYNTFMPALAFGYRSNGTPVNVLSFWSDQTTTGGNVALRYSTLTTSGSITSPVTLTASQRACPGEGVGYWGDYDGMWNDSGSTFTRLITDSTWATCDTTTRANLDYRSQDEHVSEVTFSVP